MEKFWEGFEKKASAWGHAAEIGGLGILALPSIRSLKGKPMKEKHKDLAEVAGLGILAMPYLADALKASRKLLFKR